MGDFPEDERPTGAICLACAGEGQIIEQTATRYRAVQCPWCTSGVMSMAQVAAWKARRGIP